MEGTCLRTYCDTKGNVWIVTDRRLYGVAPSAYKDETALKEEEQEDFHRLCLAAGQTFASNTQKKKTALRMYTQRAVACKCVFYLQF